MKKESNLLSKAQAAVVKKALKAGEGEFFREKLEELERIWAEMPSLSGQDGKKEDAVACLHYFRNGFHIYITERDSESLEVFGLMGREKGHQSLENILDSGFELDFHFTPATLKQIMDAETIRESAASRQFDYSAASSYIAANPLGETWPASGSVDEASARILGLDGNMNGKGAAFLGAVKDAFFERIAKEIGEGLPVSPEQQKFFEEESGYRRNSPFHQAPRPV